MDHRYEQVRDDSGHGHPFLQKDKMHLIWAPVISTSVASAEYYLSAWSQLFGMIERLEEKQARLGGRIPTDKPISDEV